MELIRKKILITHPFNRKTFDVYNILRCHFGLRDFVIIVPKKGRLESLFIRLLYGKVDLERTLRNCISNKKFAASRKIFIPIEEKDIQEYYETCQDLKVGSLNALLPSKEVFNICRDKGALSDWCHLNGIQAPKRFSYHEILNARGELSIIAKPKIGSGSKGIKFINSVEDITSLDLAKDNYIFQQRLPNGKDIQACFILAEKGRIIQSYCHERIRTYPSSGGVSVFSRYRENSRLVTISSEVVAKLDYSGVMMIEYLWDNDIKDYSLIEINPRLWGSILLSYGSGVNLLENYVRLSLGENSRLNETIRKNAHLRWLFPYDILALKFSDLFKQNVVYINITLASPLRSILFHFIAYLPRIFRNE